MNKMGIISSLLALLGAGACNGFNTVPADDFETVIADTEVQLVDVRTPEEYAEGHLAGAVNLDVKAPSFKQSALDKLDKSRPVAVYCRGGKRSARAAGMLAAQGFQVTNLEGGVQAWKEAGKPLVGDYSFETDSFTTPTGKKVRFHALVHASILIEYDGLAIYVDPVRRLGERVIDYSALPKADVVFVTHEHGDHFDKEVLEGMSDAKLYTNGRCAGMLGRGIVMANGDAANVRDDIRAEAVPAYNITEGHTNFHPKGRDNGYVLTLGGMRIYIAGDTEDIPEMVEIKDIDVAFLPCNQPYTMTPGQLVHAAKLISPKVVFPYHYSSTDVSGIAAELSGIDVRIRRYQ